MANGYNQYIGMRYVPLIMGTWAETVNYEPLVVVAYNGNSYISKTFVPAGTLPTNETYWMLAANYNAQVEQYRQEVRQYQQTVDGFSGDISDLETAVDQNTNAIATQSESIERLNDIADYVGTGQFNAVGSLTIPGGVDNYVEGGAVTLEPGGYMLVATATFASAATASQHRVQLYNKTTGQALNTTILNFSGYARLQCIHFDNIYTQNVVCARISALNSLSNCEAEIHAIRLH